MATLIPGACVRACIERAPGFCVVVKWMVDRFVCVLKLQFHVILAFGSSHHVNTKCCPVILNSATSQHKT